MGREDEGRYILGRLRGEDDGLAEAEFQDVHNIVELERKTSDSMSYIKMFFGIGSGKLHTGRRVQLVIWLQILQEWIGIAGITIYGPEIFTIAGISASDRLWVSGLNDITYMVCLHHYASQHRFPSTLPTLILVLDSSLRLHPRSYRPPLDTLLGFRRPRPLHVHRRRSRACYNKRSGRRQIDKRCRRRRDILRLPLHRHLWCHVADGALALPCRDLPLGGASERECVGCCGLEYRQWVDGTCIPLPIPITSPLPYPVHHIPSPPFIHNANAI